MNKHPYLITGSLWVLASRIGMQGAMALATILIARRFGSAGFGNYAFIASLILIGNMLTTFGTDMLLIRDIAARKDLSRIFSALLLQLLLSIVLIVIAQMLPILPGQSAAGWLALKVYSLALIPIAFFTVFSSILRGLQRMDLYAGLNLATSLLQLALIYLFIKPGGSLTTLAWVLVAVQTATAVLAGVLCKGQIATSWQAEAFSLHKLYQFFYASMPLGVLGMLGIVYQRISVILVTMWLGSSATGSFSAALRVVEFAKTGHMAVFTALYPAMAKSQKGTKGFRAEWRNLMIGAVAAAIILSMSAQPLTHFLFGTGYETSVLLLRLLAWNLVPYTMNTYLTLAFVAARQEQPVLLSISVSLTALVLFNLPWTRHVGVTGAAWSMLLAEVIQGIALLLQYKKLSLTQAPLDGIRHEFSQPS